MGFFEWGEKRFARGIAKAMLQSYKAFKSAYPHLSEIELIKKTLSTRPGIPAKTLFKDIDDDNFWKNVAVCSFVEIINILVRLEYIEEMKGDIDIAGREAKNTFNVFRNIIAEEVDKLKDQNDGRGSLTKTNESSITIAKSSFNERPTLKKEDIPNVDKVAEFVMWFLTKEEICKAISSVSNRTIFGEGLRPLMGDSSDPEKIYPDTKSLTLTAWFMFKVFFDLNNYLKNANKDEFELFIDMLNKISGETLVVYGEIGIKYKMDFNNFVYEKEVEKIPDEWERVVFKTNFLSDNVLVAETRILAWIYHDYFNEWYKGKVDLG